MNIQEASKQADGQPIRRNIWPSKRYIDINYELALEQWEDETGSVYHLSYGDLEADDWEVYEEAGDVKKEDKLIAERYVITLDGRTVGCRSNCKSVENEPGFRDIYIRISQEDLSRLGYVPKPIWRNCKTDPPGKKDDVRRLVMRNAHSRTNLLIGQYFPYKGSWGHHLPMYFHANPERFEWTEIPE